MYRSHGLSIVVLRTYTIYNQSPFNPTTYLQFGICVCTQYGTSCCRPNSRGSIEQAWNFLGQWSHLELVYQYSRTSSSIKCNLDLRHLCIARSLLLLLHGGLADCMDRCVHGQRVVSIKLQLCLSKYQQQFDEQILQLSILISLIDDAAPEQFTANNIQISTYLIVSGFQVLWLAGHEHVYEYNSIQKVQEPPCCKNSHKENILF